MSKNDKNRPSGQPARPGADNIRSEAAKEFAINGGRKNVSSKKGIDKNTRLSAEAQMSGVPVYTKKNKED